MKILKPSTAEGPTEPSQTLGPGLKVCRADPQLPLTMSWGCVPSAWHLPRGCCLLGCLRGLGAPTCLSYGLEGSQRTRWHPVHRKSYN